MTTELTVVTSSTKLASFLGMEKGMMIDTIKAQCFKGKRPDEITDEQLAAFISVASVLELNPLIPGFLYAYPERNGGITPIVGPDGTFKKLSELKGVSYTCDVFPEDPAVKPTHAVALIYVEGKDQPHKYVARFNEWNVANNPNWQTRPAHMLWLRAIKQCARQVIHGLPMDEDERHIAQMHNVTGTGEDVPAADATPRKDPPKRSTRGVSAVTENVKAETTAAAAIDVEATPAAAKPVEKVADKPAEKVAEKPVEKVAPAKTVEPAKAATADVVSQPVVLEDGKEVTVTVQIERFVEKPINGVEKSIQAEVSGAYKGNVYHLGGAGPAWQIDDPVTLRLLGKKLKSGQVAAMVQSIELAASPSGGASGGETLE